MNVQKVNSSFTTSSSAWSTCSTKENQSMQIMQEIHDQILVDPRISDSEKAMLLELRCNDDLGTFTLRKEINPVIDELINSCQDDHPYAYYYHCLKAALIVASTGNISDPEILSELNESIRLNPDFHVSYFLRGAAYFCQNNFEAGFQNLAIAAKMGNTDAQELLDQLNFI